MALSKTDSIEKLLILAILHYFVTIDQVLKSNTGVELTIDIVSLSATYINIFLIST